MDRADVTSEMIEGLRRLAQSLGAELPPRNESLWHAPADGGLSDDEIAEILATADAQHAAGERLAETAGYNVELIKAARQRPQVGCEPRWSELLGSALSCAMRANETDIERAEHLATLACSGIPADDRCFKPAHARMALDMLDFVWERERRRSAEIGWPVTDLEQAQSWLVDFEGRAEAIA